MLGRVLLTEGAKLDSDGLSVMRVAAVSETGDDMV
jgi:hypothetical protein